MKREEEKYPGGLTINVIVEVVVAIVVVVVVVERNVEPRGKSTTYYVIC
jgi:hypothetical protein